MKKFHFDDERRCAWLQFSEDDEGRAVHLCLKGYNDKDSEPPKKLMLDEEELFSLSNLIQQAQAFYNEETEL